MKCILLILSVSISFMSEAQHVKDMRKHRQAITTSQTDQSVVTSMDTLFISGKPCGTVKVFARDSGVVTAQSIYSLDSGKTLMEISRLEKADAGNDRLSFFLFSFPPLDMMCEIKSSSGGRDIYSIIRQYGLLGPKGLDTVRVETFVILKGRINLVGVGETMQKQAPKKEVIVERSVIVPRDKTRPLVFTSENIEQQGVVIGSFTEGNAETPQGPVSKISIYNSIGALICTATETKAGSNDWRLLTYRDNKFYAMASASGDAKEAVALYLIKLGLL